MSKRIEQLQADECRHVKNGCISGKEKKSSMSCRTSEAGESAIWSMRNENPSSKAVV